MCCIDVSSCGVCVCFDHPFVSLRGGAVAGRGTVRALGFRAFEDGDSRKFTAAPLVHYIGNEDRPYAEITAKGHARIVSGALRRNQCHLQVKRVSP